MLQILKLCRIFRINGAEKAGPLLPLYVHQRIILNQGIRGLDAGNVPEPAAQLHPVRNHFTDTEIIPVTYLHMGGMREQVALNFLLKTSHDGQHDNEHHHPQRDAQQADQGDDGKERAQRIQIPQRQTQTDVPAQ